MNKKCTKCGNEKDIEQFRFRDKAKGTRQSWCKECLSEHEKKVWSNSEDRRKSNIAHGYERRKRNRQYVWDYLKSHPCVLCGESDPTVLEFDHIDPKVKRKTISEMMMSILSIEKIQSEIDKCQVLCANCHARKTAEQFGYFKDIKK